MNIPPDSARLDDQWNDGPPGAASGDALDQLVYLSNLIGRETRLVQRGEIGRAHV